MQYTTDWGTIITIISCLFAGIGILIGLFLYLANKIDDINKKIDSLRNDIHLEMKDFHGRLCSLEERRKNTKTEP